METQKKAINRVSGKSASRIVMVGTYKGDQVTKWRGWYNYPISDDDRIGADDAAKITELWPFKGKKEQRNYKAEFVGVKTRKELIDDFGRISTTQSVFGASNPVVSTELSQGT